MTDPQSETPTMSHARWFTPLALTGLLVASTIAAGAGAQEPSTSTAKAKVKQKVETKVKAESKAKSEPKAEAKPADEPKAAAKAKAKAKAEPKAKAETKIEPVNINTDDADTLQELPGVGPVLAKAIIAGRPYKSVDDLKNVDGFGEAKIESIRKYVRVQVPKPAAEPKAAAKPASPKAAAPKDAAKAKETAKAKDAPATTSEKKTLEPGRKININKATAEELEELPGIGPVKAKAIVDGRPFEKPEDVMKVRGIKDETFAKIKAHISVK